MSSARTRLGYSRGKDSSGTDRAIIGFGRGATRNSLGVVRYKRANGVNPMFRSSSESLLNGPESLHKSDSCSSNNGNSCTIPRRNRMNPYDSMEDNSRQTNNVYGNRSMTKHRTPINNMKRDYSKFPGGSSRIPNSKTESNTKGNNIRDMFSKYKNSDEGFYDGTVAGNNVTARDFLSGNRNRFGNTKRFTRTMEEPEPEVYTFGPAVVPVYDNEEHNVDSTEKSTSNHTRSIKNITNNTNEYEENVRRSVTNDMPVDHVNKDNENTDSRISHLEKKWDNFLEMIDNKFTSLTSKSESLEKLVEKLATMQMASLSGNLQTTDTSLPPVEVTNSTNKEDHATHSEQSEHDSTEDMSVKFPCYGVVGIKILPLFYDIPSPELEEMLYVKECECEAEQNDMIKIVGTKTQPETQASWYKVSHTDEETGEDITLWTPAAIHNKPCFTEFKHDI